MTKDQHRLLFHGLLVLLFGLLGGIALAVNMLGVIALDPIPFKIDYALPGEMARWRAVHVGNLMNGIMAIALAAAMPYFKLSEKLGGWLSFGVVFSIYSNAIFYIFGVFAPNHGLSLGDNRMGEGNIYGAIAYAPATIAAYVSIFVVIALMLNLKKPGSDV